MNLGKMFSKDLTKGQFAIRRLASSKELIDNWRMNGVHRVDAGRQLRNICLSNPQILNDALINQKLDEPRYSSSYIEFLSHRSHRRDISNEPLEINQPFDFIYGRSDFETMSGASRDRQLYCGGIKFDSTFQCILSLADSEPLCGSGWGLQFFQNEGILVVNGGGNHRTLAHLLYGDYKFTPSEHIVVLTHNLPPEASSLNRNLLEIQSMTGSNCELRFNMRPESGDPQKIVKFVEECSTEFKELVRSFSEEEQRLQGYVSRVTLNELNQRLKEYNRWVSLNRIQRFQKKWLQSESISSFEKFMRMKI